MAGRVISGLRRQLGDYLKRQPGERGEALRARLLAVAHAVLKVLGWVRAPIEWLAVLAGTDKVMDHDYMAAYRRFFSEYRNRRMNVLEIGVGGYDRVDGGQSLRLWEAYFRRSTIVGIDLYDKTFLSRGRVRVYQCSQIDRGALQGLSSRYGGFDLVIDDGSHHNAHQIETFHIMFPLMRSQGVYVIEDTQTSYWPAFGGGAIGTPGYESSAMAFFKRLVDGVNYTEFLPAQGEWELPFKEQIRGVYFEHNMIVVLKGDNTAPSNVNLRTREQELLSSTGVNEAGHLE